MFFFMYMLRSSETSLLVLLAGIWKPLNVDIIIIILILITSNDKAVSDVC